MTILKIKRFWPSPDRVQGAELGHASEPDGLDAFGTEALPAQAPGRALKPAERKSAAVGARPAPASSPAVPALPWRGIATWAGVVILTAGLAVASVIVYQRRFAAKPTTGVLTIETTPANQEVLVAGKSVGRTPVTLPLAAGVYEVQVGDPAQRRTITANVAAGSTSVQHVELAPPAPALAQTGTLRIQTEPSRLTVLVDGVDRGVSPVTLEKVDATAHEIAVRTDHGVVRRSVKLQPGETMSLIVSAGVPAGDAGAAMTGGWLTVSSPVAMQLREGGKVIGTTESERVMLPAGDHDVEILQEALGFRVLRKIKVTAGKTSTTRIELPNGSLSLNAQPWAEVWVDGERIGETPIGNLQRPIGTHQVIFRHPEFGERRESVVISLKQPARLGVDLRKKQ